MLKIVLKYYALELKIEQCIWCINYLTKGFPIPTLGQLEWAIVP